MHELMHARDVDLSEKMDFLASMEVKLSECQSLTREEAEKERQLIIDVRHAPFSDAIP